MSRAALLACMLAVAVAVPAAAQPVPAHPDALRFQPLAYSPPSPAEHRVALPSGMVAFVAEDRTLPLVSLTIMTRTGTYLEPAGKEGLAALTGQQIRRGGTKSLTAEELDERLAFLATEVSSGIGATSGVTSMSCLAENLDESLRLLAEMLREPRFQQDRLELAKEQELQDMSTRNDDASDIEAREWNVLVYGESHFTNRFSTEASVRSITPADLAAFHRRSFHPSRMVVAVSGAFSRDEMVRKLEAAFSSWPFPAPEPSRVPGEISPAAPGLYRIQKDVNQGRVSIGLPSVRRDSPDAYALEVMNEVLGGSGFSSRITQKVRSNEGLAYAAYSSLGLGPYYPGKFRAAFQSKSRTVPRAAKMVLDEIRGIRDAPVTPEELDMVKRSVVETFPSNFASKAQAMATFAADELTGREPGYWATYRDRIQAVTAGDVERVARAYLDPARMTVLVVGDQKEIALGEDAEANLAALAGGRVTDLPLRDPMTMKRPPTSP
jgi:predicted Zn-dependent peptidase